MVPPLDIPGLSAGEPTSQPAGGGGRHCLETGPGGVCIPQGHQGLLAGFFRAPGLQLGAGIAKESKRIIQNISVDD